MKRFVTYLYLYDGRIKGNNAGFIKVEINGEKSAFLVQIKNLGKYSGKGRVYLIYEAEAAKGQWKDIFAGARCKNRIGKCR